MGKKWERNGNLHDIYREFFANKRKKQSGISAFNALKGKKHMFFS